MRRIHVIPTEVEESLAISWFSLRSRILRDVSVRAGLAFPLDMTCDGHRPPLQKKSLRAFFECTGFALKMGEGFAGEMERAGNQNRRGFGARLIERVGQ